MVPLGQRTEKPPASEAGGFCVGVRPSGRPSPPVVCGTAVLARAGQTGEGQNRMKFAATTHSPLAFGVAPMPMRVGLLLIST